VSDGPDLTREDVDDILRLVDEAGVAELDLETSRFSIRVRRGEPPETVERDTPSAAPAADGLVDVEAPLVGTFYRAPAPGEPPFVELGSQVGPDTQVCIIEVMKLMTAVVAGVRGTVAETCRADGEPVQYGDVLFRVRPA
jgi:biotin carboxyl carrier protein